MSTVATDLLVERHGHVLQLTLNRPDSLNALNASLSTLMETTLRAAGDDPDVRAVVITGAGRAFCSGADVSGLAQGAVGSNDPKDHRYSQFTMRQLRIYKPTICAVNGVCAGAGLHYVADSDIVIASSNASFVDTHVNVGQVTALEPIGLLNRMSLEAVLRMVILGKAERLTAERALEARMISEVVAPEDLIPRALELAQLAASVSPAAVQRSLKAIWESFDRPLDQAYQNGFEILIRHRSHPDALEGTRAFLEKRQPVWNSDPTL
jgi:enoyl-CoA hydratase/carnithine racemase